MTTQLPSSRAALPAPVVIPGAALFVGIFAFLLFNVDKPGESDRVMKAIPLLLLAVGAGRFLFFRRGELFLGRVLDKGSLWVLGALLTAFIVSIVRSSVPDHTGISMVNDSIKIALVFGFAYLFYNYQFYHAGQFLPVFDRLVLLLIAGPSLTILLLIGLYLSHVGNATGLTGEEGGYAVMLNNLGIHWEKRGLPFSNAHPVTAGLCAAALLVMSVVALRVMALSRWQRTALYVNLVNCTVFILLADSRGTVMNALVAIGIILVVSTLRVTGLLRWLVLVVPVLPFLLLNLLALLATTPLGEKMSRGENDLATGNSRGIVWEYCLRELGNFKSVHLVGYGELGQYAAGVSQQYGILFGLEKENEMLITHNVFIQIVFDMGYLGAFLFLMVLLLAVGNLVYLYQKGVRSALVLLGFLIYYVFSGNTESIFGNYNREYNLMFLFVVTCCITAKNAYLLYPLKPDPKPSSALAVQRQTVSS